MDCGGDLEWTPMSSTDISASAGPLDPSDDWSVLDSLPGHLMMWVLIFSELVAFGALLERSNAGGGKSVGLRPGRDGVVVQRGPDVFSAGRPRADENQDRRNKETSQHGRDLEPRRARSQSLLVGNRRPTPIGVGRRRLSA